MAEPESFQLPITYIGLDETPILSANAFLVQNQQGEFTITIAQLAPPMVMGEPDEIREQLQQIPFIPARVLGRYGLTPRRTRELIKALQENLATHDERFGDST